MTRPTHQYFAILLCAASAGLAVPAAAQEENNKQPERSEAARPASERTRPQPAGLLRALDRNGDGTIDEKEIDLAIVSLKALDKNKDGQITREELSGPTREQASGATDRARPTRPGAPTSEDSDRPRFGIPNFADMDANGDGKLSKDEVPERMKERFDRMDRNGDGYFDKEEQDVIMRFLRQRARDGAVGNNPQRRRVDRDEGQGGSVKPKRPGIDNEKP